MNTFRVVKSKGSLRKCWNVCTWFDIGQMSLSCVQTPVLYRHTLKPENMTLLTTAIDEACSFILPKVRAFKDAIHEEDGKPKPFVLGLSGMQGSGKSTWAESLAGRLRSAHQLKTLILSLDDLYHTHENLVRIREQNPSNKLFRNRGQPGTHDEVLAKKFFSSLLAGEAVDVPSFDKSRFGGEGDRVPQSEWEHVSPSPPVDVIIFEGWCVGFQAIPDEQLEERWAASKQVDTATMDKDTLSTMLMRTHPLEHLKVVNDNLRRYNETFMGPETFDYFVHLDTEHLHNVYRWRIQQEEALRAAKGTGQTDEQVIAFVEVYMPAYEIYLDRLRQEAFPAGRHGIQGRRQLRVCLDENRGIVSMNEI